MSVENPSAPAGRTDAGTAWFGVVVGLSAWGMFFAALAFSVGYLRLREPWPLPGMPALPRILPALGVLLLGASGALLHVASRASRAALSAGGAVVALAGSLAVQGFVLSSLWATGLKLPEGGPYASAVYGLGLAHGAHVLVGVLGVAWTLMRTVRGAQVRGALELWSLYGYFLFITGLILFAAVYLP